MKRRPLLVERPSTPASDSAQPERGAVYRIQERGRLTRRLLGLSSTLLNGCRGVAPFESANHERQERLSTPGAGRDDVDRPGSRVSPCRG